MHEPLLNIIDIECAHQGQSITKNLSLHVNKGALTCLLGPSGCGKTTILRAIAGIEPIYSGEIQLRGKTISTPHHILAPEKRKLAMVFQDYALFPHMDVNHNINFGLEGLSAIEKERHSEALLDVVGLAGKGKRYPHELSGGQQQRVALARALAIKPDLILLDEPFSNLDIELREQLSHDVRDILKSQSLSAILVTHDQQEAFAFSDMVGVIHQGKIVQWDTPFNVYHEPANHFVADFIGQGVFLNGTLISHDSIETELGIIQGERCYQWPLKSKVDVLIRPDDIIIDSSSSLSGVIVEKSFKGAETLYTLELHSGNRLLTLQPSHSDHDIGEQLNFHVDAQHLVAFR